MEDSLADFVLIILILMKFNIKDSGHYIYKFLRNGNFFNYNIIMCYIFYVTNERERGERDTEKER